MGDLITLAHKHQLSAYDAWYLWLAVEQGWALATLDSELARACRAEDVRRYEP